MFTLLLLRSLVLMLCCTFILLASRRCYLKACSIHNVKVVLREVAVQYTKYAKREFRYT